MNTTPDAATPGGAAHTSGGTGRRGSAVTSTAVLRRTLLWSAAVTALLCVAGAVIGYAVAGLPGLFSALSGVILAALFLGITGISILVANHWYGDPLYIPIFFGIVLGGWLLKFVLFLVALLLLRHQPWVEPMVFFLAIVAGIVASLVIDVVVLTRMRSTVAIAVDLPAEPPEDVGPTTAASAKGGDEG